jgi:hypothetical protein
VGVLPSLLQHGGIDKGAEAEAEMDRPSASYTHAYVCIADMDGWVLLRRKDLSLYTFPVTVL